VAGAGLGQHSPGETIERVRLREEVEQEVRAELEPQYAKERLEELDKARTALFIVKVLAFCLLVPLGALVLGASVRLFLYVAGFR
jgi:hypothetical protein